MWKNLPFRGYVYASLILNIILGVTILLIRASLPPVVPLFYGLPAGANQLVATLGLIVAPGASLVVTLTNVVLASFIKDQFFKKTLVISSIFVSVLVFITVLKIILLVGFF